MRIHILGICGTFMGGIALLARAGGHRVTGSDANVYPPMSDLLREQGIDVMEGYEPDHLSVAPDQVIVGNALSRGNPLVEETLNRGLAYTSGPQWLAERVLQGRQVLAVAGTHGKTTTSAMLAWVLEHAGQAPGFLVGGVPENFGVSARSGEGRAFVVEADEYDTAFFDKRSKFVHYRPRVAILNNLEFDHADIFPDLAAIQRQFHHLVRTVPGNGLILQGTGEPAIDEVLTMGCWTPVESFGIEAGDWRAELLEADGSRFQVWRTGSKPVTVQWDLVGLHNVRNALASMAAAQRLGVDPAVSAQALGLFRNVRRRLEVRGREHGVTVYDDFAHHPTAIRLTLDGLRRRVRGERILAVLEPRSNTMRMGVHQDTLAPALAGADVTFVYAPPDLPWDLTRSLAGLGAKARVFDSLDALVEAVLVVARPGDHLLVMSNGSFGGVQRRLLEGLRGVAT